MEADLLLLKWNSHSATFFHVLSNLRKKEAYTDATIACEGKFFPVHKLVLSTCSDYFGEIFERTSCKSPVIILKDIKPEELETLLDYMYLGEVNVKQSDLASIIKAAECLQVKGLILQDVDLLSEATMRTLSGQSPPAKRQKKDLNCNQSSNSTNSVHFKSVPFPEIGDGSALVDSNKDSSMDEEQSIFIPVTSMKVEMEDDQLDLEADLAKADDADVSADGDLQNKSDETCNPESLESGVETDIAGPSGVQKENSLWGDWAKISGQEGEVTQENKSMDTENLDAIVNSQQCPICYKNIKNLHNFQVHIRSHVERKLHICQYCPYSSMKVSDIQKHVRIHTGEKPYSCQFCSYRFSRSYHLKRHLLRIHSNQMSTADNGNEESNANPVQDENTPTSN